MAETAISAVLSKFGELTAREVKIQLEVGDNMTLLRDRLEWLQAFIRDADRRRRAGTHDQLTHVWVRQTREVSFQAEDALDEFVYQVDRLQSQGYRRWKKMWRQYLFGWCTQIVSRRRLSFRITRINMRLAKIAENQKEYNIAHTPSLMPVMSSTTATSAWPDDAVGFDGDVRKLRQLLLHEDRKRLMFISILGESGVGKRTLVKMIKKEVISEFSFFLLLAVPADSTVHFILQTIYKLGLDKSNQPQEESINDIAVKLRGLLEGKRYLVVLNGIPSKTMLSCVRASLPDDNNGSRVLLVLDTEYEEVAWHANTMNKEGFNGIHMLSRLDEKGSGLLFRSRAFRREILVCNDGSKEADSSNRDDKYDKIVFDITGGYPLAIVVLAALLRFKERPGQWEAVLQQLRPTGTGPSLAEAPVQGDDGEGSKHITEEVEQSTDHSNLVSTRTTAIERVFWASFEDLPNDLKSCLLCFTSSPKKTVRRADEAVQMWIAEGFIKPQKGKTVEELGHNYIKELVSRCLLQIDKMDGAGGIEKVKVHPRLHGFLQSEAREAGFMEYHDMHHAFVPPSVRRLSYMIMGGRYIPFTSKFPKLRSIRCWVEEEQHHSNDSQDTNSKKHVHDLEFLCGSKFLRLVKVLGLRIEELPNRIGDLINLRYLAVKKSKDLKELPSSIKRLLNLQTLDIQGTQVEMIDPGFWKIRTLRHVLADKLTLPPTIEEELAELQTLSGVKPAQGEEWKEQNCPLHKMPNLRTLKLHGIAHAKQGAALKSALMKMHLLGDLILQGDVITSSVFTAPSLRCLQTVELDGNVEWPEDGWDASKVRPNLVDVKLRNSNEVPPHMQEQIDKIRKPNAGSRHEISTNAAQGEMCEGLLPLPQAAKDIFLRLSHTFELWVQNML